MVHRSNSNQVKSTSVTINLLWDVTINMFYIALLVTKKKQKNKKKENMFRDTIGSHYIYLNVLAAHLPTNSDQVKSKRLNLESQLIMEDRINYMGSLSQCEWRHPLYPLLYWRKWKRMARVSLSNLWARLTQTSQPPILSALVFSPIYLATLTHRSSFLLLSLCILHL